MAFIQNLLCAELYERHSAGTGNAPSQEGEVHSQRASTSYWEQLEKRGARFHLSWGLCPVRGLVEELRLG